MYVKQIPSDVCWFIRNFFNKLTWLTFLKIIFLFYIFKECFLNGCFNQVFFNMWEFFTGILGKIITSEIILKHTFWYTNNKYYFFCI